MLDGTHSLMLRGVAKGIPDSSPPAPALQSLIAVGLVVEGDDHRFALTETGRYALSGGSPEGRLSGRQSISFFVSLALFFAVVFGVVNLINGDALLSTTQIIGLVGGTLLAGVWVRWYEHRHSR